MRGGPTRKYTFRKKLLFVVLGTLLSVAPAVAQPKTDVNIRTSDGISLEATIMQPLGLPPSGGFPGVVLIHGYGGKKDNMLPFSYILASYGYASIVYSVRGQGNSGGLSSTDGPREVQDLREVIDYFRASKDINPDKIGVAGGSQGGIHSWMAAVHRMPGVKAVAPLIATPDFARTLVPNGVVRYALPLEMKLGSVRYSDDRDRVRDYIIADQYDSVMAYINARDLEHLVDSVQVPVFQMLGWADFIFPSNGAIRAAANLTSRGIPVWSYYGTNGHGESVDAEESAFQVQLLVKWFDHWLKGFSLSQDSLSMVYYADDRPGWPHHATQVWPPQPSRALRLYLTDTGLRSTTPEQDASYPFALEYNSSYTPAMGWSDTYGGSRFTAAFKSTDTRLITSPLSEAIEVTGIPTGRIRVQSDAEKFQAHVGIFDVDGDTWKLISRSVNGIRGNTPGQTHELAIEATALSHIVPTGHRIGIEVTSLDMLRMDQANTVPYFVSSHSMLFSKRSAPSYIDIPVVGNVPTIAAVGETGEKPGNFGLMQNYPNPFNPTTTINYTVGERERGRVGDGERMVLAQLVVYDVLGREVKTLVNEQQAPGHYSVRFDGVGLSSGVYFYRLTAGSFTEARRMMLLK